jgi:hypothetical protein
MAPTTRNRDTLTIADAAGGAMERGPVEAHRASHNACAIVFNRKLGLAHLRRDLIPSRD